MSYCYKSPPLGRCHRLLLSASWPPLPSPLVGLPLSPALHAKSPPPPPPRVEPPSSPPPHAASPPPPPPNVEPLPPPLSPPSPPLRAEPLSPDCRRRLLTHAKPLPPPLIYLPAAAFKLPLGHHLTPSPPPPPSLLTPLSRPLPVTYPA